MCVCVTIKDKRGYEFERDQGDQDGLHQRG